MELNKVHRRYTEEHIEYIRSIAPGKYNDEITKKFNNKFNLAQTIEQISSMKANHKIVSGKLPSRKRYKSRLFSQEQEKFIRANVEGLSNKELAELINDKFNLEIKTNQMKIWKANHKVKSGLTGRFENGQKSWNKGMKGLNTGGEKGWFVKGQEPINYRPVGSERITKDGYITTKIKDDGKRNEMWKLKHIVLWEKHNGKLPSKHAIVFLNSDRKDVRIENLGLITRAELARMNKNDLFSTDPEITKTSINLVRLNQKVSGLELYGGDEEVYEQGIEAAKRNGLKKSTFIMRLNRGWDMQDAINKPLNHKLRRVKING